MHSLRRLATLAAERRRHGMHKDASKATSKKRYAEVELPLKTGNKPTLAMTAYHGPSGPKTWEDHELLASVDRQRLTRYGLDIGSAAV